MIVIPWWIFPIAIAVLGTIWSFWITGRESGGSFDLSGLFGCGLSMVFWIVALILAVWLKP